MKKLIVLIIVLLLCQSVYADLITPIPIDWTETTEDFNTTGTLGAGAITGTSLITGSDIGIAGDTDLIQLTAGTMQINGSLGIGNESTEGTTHELRVYGYPTGGALKYGFMKIEGAGNHFRFGTADGCFKFQTDEGTNTSTYFDILGKGTGQSYIRAFGPSETNYFVIGYVGVNAELRAAGSTHESLSLQSTADVPIKIFEYAASGETQEVQIGGYRTGDSLRFLEIGVGVDAADTASFDGLSEYRFDGTVRANTAFNVNGSAGVSGTLELDDGGTEKVTLVFTGGILTSRTVAATTGSVLVDWTD